MCVLHFLACFGEITVTTQAPITVEQLIEYLIPTPVWKLNRLSTMLHQFAAEQRAAGAAELQQLHREKEEWKASAEILGAQMDELRAELAAAKQQLAEAEKERNRVTLTGDQIADLFCFLGHTLHDDQIIDDDAAETLITITDCPADGVIDDDGVTRRHYEYIAYYDEYPEEGCIGLGKEIDAARTAQANSGEQDHG